MRDTEKKMKIYTYLLRVEKEKEGKINSPWGIVMSVEMKRKRKIGGW